MFLPPDTAIVHATASPFAEPDWWAVIIAALAFAVSVAAWIEARKTRSIAYGSELSSLWKDLRHVKDAQGAVIEPSLRAAIHAMDRLSRSWLSGYMDRKELVSDYLPTFQQLFREIDSIDKPVPGHRQTGQEMLTPKIRKVYDEMNKEANRGVR